MSVSPAPDAIEVDQPLASSEERPVTRDVDLIAGQEILAVVLWVIAADLTLFRASGYAGPAVFLIAGALVLWLGRRRGSVHQAWKGALVLLAAVSLRLICCGSPWILTVGSAVLIGFAMTLAGAAPLVLESIAFIGHIILGGGRSLSAVHIPSPLRSASRSGETGRGAVLLPLAALLVFSTLFVLANPDLLSHVSKRLETAALAVFDWMLTFSPLEIAFWSAAAWIGIGMLRPSRPLTRIGPVGEETEVTAEPQPAPLFTAVRNMLVVVIALFAVYLIFEFSTLWFRQFPEGFYYAGYAHQGAMWLTIVLALSTATLSFALGKPTAGDPRRNVLKSLAWVWSLENLLLAAAVYNRLAIYVGYNGMTQMRVIGIFGVTAVLIGFLLMIYKITHGRSFWWLIRSQLLTLALLTIVHAIIPVDYIVHRHNVSRVMSGDLKPSVQIAVKEIDALGMLTLFPLLRCDDPLIREGVAAMLRQQRRELRYHIAAIGRSRPTVPRGHHWTEYQWATERLAEKLHREPLTQSPEGHDPAEDQEAIERFIQYAMQWY